MDKSKFTTIHCLYETKKMLDEIYAKEPSKKAYYLLDDIVKFYQKNKKDR